MSRRVWVVWPRPAVLTIAVAFVAAACSPAVVMSPSPSTDATTGPAAPATSPPSVGSPLTSPETSENGASPMPSRIVGSRSLPDSAWRVVGEAVNEASAGQMWVVTEEQGYRARWRELMGSREPPGFDPAQHVAAFYHVLVPSDCPDLLMSAIEVDGPLIYGLFVPPVDQASRECSEIAGSHSFVVFIDRASLPSGPVDFRVMREFQLCDTCGREGEEVRVEL